MIWPRKLGVSLVVAGGLLLGVYLVPTVYGNVLSRLQVLAFRTESGTNGMWDSARIRAYQRTLQMSFAPPEAVLRIAKVGVEVPVLEGTSDVVLNRGVGHIPGTALPGEGGNVAITGHRDGFFRPLKDIVPGDVIEVERPQSVPGARKSDRYVVRRTQVVSPSDMSVLKPTAEPTLTLITCYPFYYVGAAPQRFVVQASLLPATQLTAAAKVPPLQSSSGE